MGKCVRIRGSKQPSPPSPAEAAAYLTLRSGRRVPVAVAVAAAAAATACSPPRTPSTCGGRRGSSPRAEAAKKRACGSPRRKSAAASPLARVLVDGAGLCGGRLLAERPPSSQADDLRLRADGGGGCGDDDDSFEPPSAALDGGDALVAAEERRESKGVAGRPPSPLEAEMEAFFAAAELAERRRFAEAYNYDVALDRPLEGRFEWAPVMSA